MLALPHYTQAEFDETLELIEEGGATHISAYLLKIEPDSAFGRTPPEGLPTSDEAADFYLYAVEQLEHHGYRQYEISNFARPGYEGKHNLIYWDCGDYLGIGPAAHSCMGGKRFYYPADTEAFPAGRGRAGHGRRLRGGRLSHLAAPPPQGPEPRRIQKTLWQGAFHRTAGLSCKTV